MMKDPRFWTAIVGLGLTDLAQSVRELCIARL